MQKGGQNIQSYGDQKIASISTPARLYKKPLPTHYMHENTVETSRTINRSLQQSLAIQQSMHNTINYCTTPCNQVQ